MQLSLRLCQRSSLPNTCVSPCFSTSRGRPLCLRNDVPLSGYAPTPDEPGLMMYAPCEIRIGSFFGKALYIPAFFQSRVGSKTAFIGAEQHKAAGAQQGHGRFYQMNVIAYDVE